MMTDFG